MSLISFSFVYDLWPSRYQAFMVFSLSLSLFHSLTFVLPAVLGGQTVHAISVWTVFLLLLFFFLICFDQQPCSYWEWSRNQGIIKPILMIKSVFVFRFCSWSKENEQNGACKADWSHGFCWFVGSLARLFFNAWLEANGKWMTDPVGLYWATATE